MFRNFLMLLALFCLPLRAETSPPVLALNVEGSTVVGYRAAGGYVEKIDAQGSVLWRRLVTRSANVRSIHLLVPKKLVISVDSECGLVILDAGKGKIGFNTHLPGSNCLTTTSGNLLAYAEPLGAGRWGVFDLVKRKYVAQDSLPAAQLTAVAINPAYPTIVIGVANIFKKQPDFLFRFYYLDTHKFSDRVLPDFFPVSSISYSPDGRTLTYASGKSLHLIDTNNEIAQTSLNVPPTSMFSASDGHLIVLLKSSPEFLTWNASSKARQSCKVTRPVSAVMQTESGYVTGHEDGTIQTSAACEPY